MSKKSLYEQTYRDLEIIGRGNFGSATLVQLRADPSKHFIAKKIILSSLKEREQEGALQEAKILKTLKHPFIVSYQDSFIEDDVLIILMEYCEEGDLAFHIKRRKQKKEFFPEKLILNWFLQLCIALKYIHERKILHRDLKTSNIFLTSNGTVKIGDFGISRIMEGTHEQAHTVVGTPYYMSPEICESKPYTYKSDIWALGCCLYEICTLKHAFDAKNLLGLVYQIIQEKVENIPAIYSKELQTVVHKMLTKNSDLRPSIHEVLNDAFIQKTMQEFVKNRGRLQQEKIPIKKTLTHGEYKKLLDESHSSSNSSAVLQQHEQLKSPSEQSVLGETMQSQAFSGSLRAQAQKKNNDQFQDGDVTLNSQFLSTQEQNQIRLQSAQSNSTAVAEENRSYANDSGVTVASMVQSTAIQQQQKQQQQQQQQQQSQLNQSATLGSVYINTLNVQGGALTNASQQRNSFAQDEESNLTPHEQMLRRKLEKSQRQQEEINRYTKEISANAPSYKEKKRQELYGGTAQQQQNQSFLDNTVVSQNQTQRQVDITAVQGKKPYADTYAASSQLQERKPPPQTGSQSQVPVVQGQFSQQLLDRFSQVQQLSASAKSIQRVPQVLQSSYQEDDRPIRPSVIAQQTQAAKNQDNSFLGTQFSYATGTVFERIPIQKKDEHQSQKANAQAEDDLYEDDFEEYNSDEEGEVQEDARLTSKASDQELDDILSVYKNAIEQNNHTRKQSIFTPLDEIQEVSQEFNRVETPLVKKARQMQAQQQQQAFQQQNPSLNDRALRLKQQCMAEIGEVHFNQVYAYLKQHRQKGTDDKAIEKAMQQGDLGFKIGRAQLLLVDQIIFLETFETK